jgi:hypothetical protein
LEIKADAGNSDYQGYWREVTDNPKPGLKQKQSKHGTKWTSLILI